MASHAGSKYERIQNEVLQKLRSDDNADFKRLQRDPGALKKVETAIKKTYDELQTMLKHADSLDNALGHLSSERKSLIKRTFRLQSFQVEMQRQPNGRVNLKCATITGGPLSFARSALKLGNYEDNRVLLAARIIFEVVALVLNLVGLSVTPSSEATAETILYISSIIYANASLYADINQMVDADAENDMGKVAKAIVACFIDLFSIIGTPILEMVKLILQDMSWFDRIVAGGQVLCFIATLVASAGIAVLAKVISWLLNATAFVEKLTSMRLFQSYHSK